MKLKICMLDASKLLLNAINRKTLINHLFISLKEYLFNGQVCDSYQQQFHLIKVISYLFNDKNISFQYFPFIECHNQFVERYWEKTGDRILRNWILFQYQKKKKKKKCPIESIQIFRNGWWNFFFSWYTTPQFLLHIKYP